MTDELGEIDELISRYSKDETNQRTIFGGVQELIEACLKMQAKVTGAEKAVREMQDELLSQSSAGEEVRQQGEERRKRIEKELSEVKKESDGLQVRLLELEVECESRVSRSSGSTSRGCWATQGPDLRLATGGGQGTETTSSN